MITDLTIAFLNEYKEGDKRTEGENHNNYYLGPFVVSEKEGQRSIIDGQQRLTSLNLLLIYLNNLQKTLGIGEKIEPLIFSEHRGIKSFNLQVEERRVCLNKLFLTGAYAVQNNDDASTANMAERYADTTELFPEDIKGNNLPFFIDWLKYNVVLVEIIAYSDDNAYTHTPPALWLPHLQVKMTKIGLWHQSSQCGSLTLCYLFPSPQTPVENTTTT